MSRSSVGQPISTLQGVAAQNVVINPEAFYPATRRLGFGMRSVGPWAGFGSTDTATLKQVGIISAVDVRISGTLVFGGTIAGTTMSWRWPYDLVSAAKISANGQANLINASGLKLMALTMVQQQVTDRGVKRSVAGVDTEQGTLSMASHDWGTSGVNKLGPGATVAATGTYTVDFTIRIPVAFDQRTLLGSVFAQTAQTNLSCDIEYAQQSAIVTLGGAATIAANLQSEISGVVYTIPQVGGQFVVPDLSAFHQYVQGRTTAVAQGDNEIMLPGTGIGRQLMRIIHQVWTGNGAAATPLKMNAANFGQMGWRYGGNDTPEVYRTGQSLRETNERQTGCDIGGVWGFGMHDFASEWALRDAVDEGATSDLRFLVNLVNAPTAPAVEFAQQTVFAAPVGA